MSTRRMRKACTVVLKDAPFGTVAVSICIGPAPFAGVQYSTVGLPRPGMAKMVAEKFRELADEIDREGLKARGEEPS